MAKWDGTDRRIHVDNNAIMYKLGGMEEKMDTCITHITACNGRHEVSEQYIHDQKLYGKAGAWMAAGMFSVGMFFMTYGDKVRDFIKESLK